MSDTAEQANWREEFEKAGETRIRDTIYHGPGIYPDPKRLFALDWLSEREKQRQGRDRRAYWILIFTFVAAVVAATLTLTDLIHRW